MVLRILGCDFRDLSSPTAVPHCPLAGTNRLRNLIKTSDEESVARFLEIEHSRADRPAYDLFDVDLEVRALFEWWERIRCLLGTGQEQTLCTRSRPLSPYRAPCPASLGQRNAAHRGGSWQPRHLQASTGTVQLSLLRVPANCGSHFLPKDASHAS